MTGEVKWYDPNKGYGFIKAENGEDVYVHATGIKTARIVPTFKDGDKVSFEIKTGRNGKPIASDVVLDKYIF